MPKTTTQKPTLRTQLHAEAVSQIDGGKYSTKSAAFEAAGSVLGKTAGNVSTAYNSTNNRLHAEVADLIASGSSQEEAIQSAAEKHHTSVEAVSHAYGAKTSKQAVAGSGKAAVKHSSNKVVASVEGMAHSVSEKLAARSNGKGKASVVRGAQGRKRAARNESAAALAAQGAELYQRAADASRRRVQEAENKLKQVRADHAERLAQEERDLEKRKASHNRAFERQEKKAAANLAKVKDDSAAEIAKYETLAKAIS